MTLIPIKLVDEPPADKGLGRDIKYLGIDEQGVKYALKTVEPEAPLVPLIEWLCYNLCALAGIYAPDYFIVTRLEGSLAFASRWVEGSFCFSPAKNSEAQLITWLAECSDDVGNMFAIDATLPNQDRNFGNVLFLQTASRLRAMAIDWSRAFMFEPWPWPKKCISAVNWEWMDDNQLANLSAVNSRMARLKAITGDQIKQILEAAPQEWRKDIDVEAAAQFWEDIRDNRVESALKILGG